MGKLAALLALLLATLALTACGSNVAPTARAAAATATKPPLTKVSVALDWFPWSNHSGLYVARERGYFADEGLDVEIRTPGDPSTVPQLIATGRDDFGINYETGVLLARQEGVPVVSVMALVQHPLNSVMALQSSGVQEPRDLAGKKVGWPGIPDNEALLDSMLKSQGHSLEDVELVNVGFDLVPALISGQVDAIVGAYWAHESISATNQGFPVNIMRAEEYGVPDFYELVLIASESKIRDNPDQVQRFIRAARRGYQDALADPQGAVQILKQARSEVDLAIESPGVDLLKEVWQAPNGVFGWQEESKWVSYAQWLQSNGLLDGSVDPKQAFDNTFVANTR